MIASVDTSGQPDRPQPIPPGAIRRQIIFWSALFLLGVAAILYGLLRRPTVQWEAVGLGVVVLLCVVIFGVSTWLYRGRQSPYRGKRSP